MTRKLEHGGVWLADLNPQRGTEPGKTRPVLIIQHQALLDAGYPSTLVIPLTTRLIEDAAPLRLRFRARERLEHDFGLRHLGGARPRRTVASLDLRRGRLREHADR